MARSAARTPLVRQDAPEPLGKRAQSKLEKRTRILNAAREVFAEKGFPSATMQQIAERAGVAVGTLFIHARSKEELLFSAFWDELAEVTTKADANMPQAAGVLEQLLYLYGAITEYHEALGAELSAVLLKELMYGDALARRRAEQPSYRGLGTLAREILERGQQSRELRAGIDPHRAGDMLFSIFLWELTHWAVGRLTDEEMKERLQSKLELCIKGLAR